MEERISMHSDGPPATSQPSLFSHTHGLTAQLTPPLKPPPQTPLYITGPCRLRAVRTRPAPGPVPRGSSQATPTRASMHRRRSRRIASRRI